MPPRSSVALSHLQKQDPYEFEETVADIWSAAGWNTTITSKSTDRGVDVIAERAKQSTSQKTLCFIQAKCYSRDTKVTSGEIQKYSGLYQRDEPIDQVVVVTSNEFTKEAEEVAAARDVELINGRELINLIEHANLSIDRLTRYTNNSTTNKIKKSGYTKSRPWRIECPFCGSSIHDSSKSFIEHWALSNHCEFDPISDEVPEQFDISSSEIKQRIKQIKAEKRRSHPNNSNPPMDCPFCKANLERSTTAYIEHLASPSCNIDSIEEIPSDRPSEIPVEIWWELKAELGFHGVYERSVRKRYRSTSNRVKQGTQRCSVQDQGRMSQISAQQHSNNPLTKYDRVLNKIKALLRV